jgi:DUF1680 family protein
MPHPTAAGPVDTTASPHSTWQTLPFSAARIIDGFWAKHRQTNRQVSLRHGLAMLERASNLHNLRLAAGWATGVHAGRNFSDETVYKWLEALAWELGGYPDAGLQQMADDVIDLVEAAQQPDGYLNSYYTVVEPDRRWTDLDHGHELYCAGHLFQAAIAFQRAVGDTRLLAVARRLADHIDTVFGPDKRQGACGHPEVEMALVELYRCTQERRYLRLAQFFIDQRGQRKMRGFRANGPEYHQDHVPVRDVQAAAGHAVRQMYLATGVSDVCLESGELALIEAMRRLWDDIASTKLFITGGVGARFDGEAFGEPYELPSDQCYCETCAAIGNLMWNWRLLLLTGDARHADLIERTLYNGILSSPSLDGEHYFYVNPLMLRNSGQMRTSSTPLDSRLYVVRPEWHYVACCPPNVMRLLASLSHYLATYDRDGIQIHQYASADITAELSTSGQVALKMTTDYPWNGAVRLTIVETHRSDWTLHLRIPAWCKGYRLTIDGAPAEQSTTVDGYLALTRAWRVGSTIVLDLDMQPKYIAANPRIDALRGCLAIQRGPLVYCLEGHDQPAGVNLLGIRIDPAQPLHADWSSTLFGGTTTIRAGGYALDLDSWQGQLYRPFAVDASPSLRSLELTAIPYYAWANRGPTSMRVWIPRLETDTREAD